MIKKESKNVMRIKRHKKIRQNLSGTNTTPRLCVFRSNTAIYAQLIDDVKGVTVASSSSLELKAKKAKIKTVVFDRGGYLYHGRVKALAEAARENGLEF